MAAIYNNESGHTKGRTLYVISIELVQEASWTMAATCKEWKAKGQKPIPGVHKKWQERNRA